MEELRAPRLRRVINATGVLLHTNLGRARLAATVASEMARVAGEPVQLEVDLTTNRRGGRAAGAEAWLCSLTGAEAAAVVNNGAAALWLAVRANARRGASVIVSRGEQVAIGGSFRMPELLRTTGAKMVEVGTTNRTEIADYANAAGPGDVVLKVHPSNYRIEGFHEEVELAELSRICRDREAILIFDAGSGSLYNFTRFGLQGEATLGELLRQGPDLVTCSGDKLLSGPQAGIVVGCGPAVQRVRKHPLMRALRLDKSILAGLEETLRCYAHTPNRAVPDLPLFEALSVSVVELRRRAQSLVASIAPHLKDDSAPDGGRDRWSASVVASSASMGAGSFANAELRSVAVEVKAPTARSASSLHRQLRSGRPAVLARIDEDRVLLDLRAVTETEVAELGDVLSAILRETVAVD
jgi:L-seryl-tRNA(Ser) seleniumtransferase